ncbi:MAG: trehalase family glycosidase [Bryobacteraceae bacterium]|jgi:alpha,alpha-trehalase
MMGLLASAIGGHPGRAPTPILEYIKATWPVLTRSHRDLAVAAIDPKFHPPANGRWPVWVGEHEDIARVERDLRGAMKADFQKIELRRLPHDMQVQDHGLLYLPKPYVVPGGRFNELYGWDSYFIELGLLRDGEIALAKDMVDDFLYEIREYGKILNANRTYYLTRSQPPFLTEMILALYGRTQDNKWLEETVPAIESSYGYWTTAPHLTPETELSRYYDSGEGPAPEVVSSEIDSHGHNDYDLIRQYFRTHQHVADYDVSQFYDRAAARLTPQFYKGDRSMRESGFDPSNRFGPFSADIIHYNPVCLNSLLYLMETQSAEIAEILRHPKEAAKWKARASERAARVNRLMWDAEKGLYFDYNFVQQRIREYQFVTTFYPLWAGIASRDQAERVVRNLPLFECPGGLQTSTHHSGDQWDAPFGWAPLQLIAVHGLRRYGYQAEADRVSKSFLTLVLREYEKHGTLDEKYDVVHLRADIGRGILFGYRTNVAGFGWTNAVFTALYDQLPADARAALVR